MKLNEIKIQFTEYKKYLRIRLIDKEIDKEIEEIIEVSTGLNKNQTVELFKNIRKKHIEKYNVTEVEEINEKINIDDVNKKKIGI